MENVYIYKKLLEQQLSDLKNQLETIATKNLETGDWEIVTDDITQADADENTQADNTEEADSRITILAELENKYNYTQHALLKITQGTYGICEICSQPIEEKRLQANAAARTCINHMEEEYRIRL